jgi:CheY-like chemotaxis protein
MAEELKGRRVLIVEDDTLLHGLLVKHMASLLEKGVDIDSTRDAEAALKKIEEHRPDLIMLDLVLPSMGGFEFLEKLRQNPVLEKTPVLLLTNLNTEADRERARALHVVAYLVKADFSLSDISATIEDILLGKQMHAPTAHEPTVVWSRNRYIVHL